MTETEPRIIKKYPNRRLYDTAISSYITLEDVKRLVIDQVTIKIIDARSQDDITHSTLLQIIIEQEENGPSLFSIESLQHMIRSYGGVMQRMMSKMFEQGMEICRVENSVQSDPLRVMTDFTQKNMAHWQELQHQWLNTVNSYSKATAPAEEADPEQKEVAAQSSSINNLK